MAEEAPGITLISVAGFKSIENSSIEIRPLTILAGANSSGKSSIMQPMLLMKQTLDAFTDPGPLLLSGPHVQFTEYDQLLRKTGENSQQTLSAGYAIEKTLGVVCEFTLPNTGQEKQRHIRLSKMGIYDLDSEKYELTPQMTEEDLENVLPERYKQMLRFVLGMPMAKENNSPEDEIDRGLEVRLNRCFLDLHMFDRVDESKSATLNFPLLPVSMVQQSIERLIHVPGLRGNPQRVYPFTPVQGPEFSGLLQNYTASLIWRWQEEDDSNLNDVWENLTSLGLTKWVKAERVDDVNVKLKVGRLPVASDAASGNDSVDIADVGFGVSQVLPVLVALAVAEPGQMVYIEQPELHLHPRAQVAMAEVLSDAVKRGVRVVVETHSPLLLQGIMTLIAEDKLESDKVMLHWFQRDEEGKTEITSVEPDENGAYGEWPEDFVDVELDIQGKYLDAVAEREMAV